MHTIAASHHQQDHSGFLFKLALKIIPPILVLLYAANHLSTGQLVLSGLMASLALALFFKIENMSTIETNSRMKISKTVFSDGGSFRPQKSDQHKVNVRAVVKDGGSFKRSSSL